MAWRDTEIDKWLIAARIVDGARAPAPRRRVGVPGGLSRRHHRAYLTEAGEPALAVSPRRNVEGFAGTSPGNERSTAALLEQTHNPNPTCVAALRDLLANGHNSPLYNEGVHSSELHANLYYIHNMADSHMVGRFTGQHHRLSAGRRTGSARRYVTMVLLSLAVLSLVAGKSIAAPMRPPRVSVRVFKLPDEAQPTGEFATGTDGSLWFSEANSTGGEILGQITSEGLIRQIRDPDTSASAQGIAVQPDGDVWFDRLSLYAQDQIERLSPSGVATYFQFSPVFNPGAKRLVAGIGGTIWFTTGDRALGRLDPSGVMTRFPLPHLLVPNGIIKAPDGDIWFTSTVGIIPVFVHDYIGRMTPSGNLTLFRIPTLGTEPKGIAWGADGNIWFGARGAIERLTTAGRFTRFPMKLPGSQPQGMAAGANGIWFSDPGTNKIGFITLSGKVTEYGTPSRDNGLSAIAVRPGGVVWFQDIGERGGGAIGRLTHHG